MFKVNNKASEDVINVVLLSSLFSLNIFLSFSIVFIVDFEKFLKNNQIFHSELTFLFF